MGFGIAFLGYCFLLLHQAGLGIIGAPMLAYGFFLASRLNKHFAAAAVSALFLLPRGILVLLDLFLPILGMEGSLAQKHPWLNLSTYLLFFIAWFFTVLWHCLAVKEIAIECDHVKLKNTASRVLYISTVFILFAMSMIVFQGVINDPRLLMIGYLAFYAVLLYNMIFTHTCLVMITTAGQYEKDKEFVAEQDRKAAERNVRDKKREQERRNVGKK